ncbi:MAG: SLBB domain-containing protein [candidate division Zixibacteria bacterium]|nr:SLBB domain-containing protein [candidate division Zixibacteria bacterium]
MKKVIVTSILIIILVCINWISDGYAQITPEQMKAYQEMMKSRGSTAPGKTQTYKTPPIYNSEDNGIQDSLEAYYNKGTDSASYAARQHRDRANTIDLLKANPSDNVTTVTAKNQLILPDSRQVNKFGHNLFSNPQVGEINSMLVPDDYLLGPGDNIIISLWGRVQQEWNLTVDRQGKVFIPKVGEITAWGMTLGLFEERLDAALSKVYSGYKRKITLGKIRTIKVFVYGEVKAPGGYAVSALSTLFNVLHRAGGSTENGSMRQIKLIRNSQTQLIDLYDFLITGDNGCDKPLMSGDVIFVPLAGPQATIRGEVKRPAIYELVNDQKVSDLIEMAGGPTANAYLGRLMLDRITEDDSRKILDLNYKGENSEDPQLVNGDDLSIFSIYTLRQNIVWVSGMVKHPGTYERIESMCLSDLIDNGQLLPNNVYLDRADLYRKHSDGTTEILAINLRDIIDGTNSVNIPLQDMDSLHIYDISKVEQEKYVYIDGLVQAPGQYPLYKNMNINDLIFLAGNFKESAYMLTAELARIDEKGNTNVLYVHLDDENGRNMQLLENDQLFIRKIPGYQLHRTVTIEGEVNFPGEYSLSKNNETLWQLLHRAGGFTKQAFPIGAVFKRKAIVEELNRKNISNILATSQPLMADSLGILRPIETITLRPESMDRIIIDMEMLMATYGMQGDFKLQTGDYIYIPEVPTGISVLGEISANGTIRYEKNTKVKDYIKKAGGFTKRADKGETRLVTASGQVYANGNVLSKKVSIGDVIIVPSEIKKEKDWFKFISTSLSVLTGVATTFLIIDRL